MTDNEMVTAMRRRLEAAQEITANGWLTVDDPHLRLFLEGKFAGITWALSVLEEEHRRAIVRGMGASA